MIKRTIAGTSADATLPKTPVTVGGREYDLCFDITALLEAEHAINDVYRRAKLPNRVNLLVALGELNLENTCTLFAAGVRTFHPEIAFDEARRMLKLADVFAVAAAIGDAWTEAVPEATKQPGPIEADPDATAQAPASET
jgi:hypothetical protein